MSFNFSPWRRCFAFGCSLTNHSWPTVADTIGINFTEYYNLGQPGASNAWMAQRFFHANQIYKFDPIKDFIIFQTTGWRRFSFYDQGQWQLSGDIIKAAENYEPPQEVYNVESQIYANVISLESVRQYLANRNYTSLWIPGLDFYEVLMIDPYFQPRSKDLQKIIDLERSLFGNDPLYLMTSAKRQRDQLGGKKHGVDFLSGEGDGHPTITEVKQYLESKMPRYLTDRGREFLGENEDNFKWASKNDQQKFYSQQQEKWRIRCGNSRSLWLD